MGLFSRKTGAQRGRERRPEPNERAAPQDPGLPGSAGYSGKGSRKGAMPERRFNFVRPDGQQPPQRRR